MSYDDGRRVGNTSAGVQMTRRVVVTGATGLLGREVVRQLVMRGNEVLAIVRPGGAGRVLPGIAVAEIDLSLASAASFADLGRYDAVIHLAQAPGWHDFPRNAGAIAAVTLTATACLAEAAVVAGAKTFVLASSGGIYGPAAAPIREDAPIKPAAELGFYLSAKAQSERLLSYFSEALTTQILRPFFIYGAGQSEAFLISRLVRSLHDGRAIRVDRGRGPYLNPIYVSDAAQAFISAAEAAGPLTVNIAGPQTLSLRAIAEEAANQIGRSAIFDETTNTPSDYVADIDLMHRTVGAPKVAFASGLQAMLAAMAKR